MLALITTCVHKNVQQFSKRIQLMIPLFLYRNYNQPQDVINLICFIFKKKYCIYIFLFLFQWLLLSSEDTRKTKERKREAGKDETEPDGGGKQFSEGKEA